MLIFALIFTTILAVLCAIGWRYSHTLLKDVMELENWEQFVEVRDAWKEAWKKKGAGNG